MGKSADRVVVSICGPAGSGKSELAKAIVESLGPNRCTRAPTDYYAVPADGSLAEYFAKPLRYDWPLLALTLSLPEGSTTSTPDFDFETFQRISDLGGQPFVVRRVMVIDAMEPYPASAARILIDAPESVRQTRIAARDTVWGTRVRDRWQHLEATWARARALAPAYDLELDGSRSVAANADCVTSWLIRRFDTQGGHLLGKRAAPSRIRIG